MSNTSDRPVGSGIAPIPALTPDGTGGAVPNAGTVQSSSSLVSLFTTDFGGTTVSADKWDVLDGGLAANTNLGFGALQQTAIGSGITGITDSVANSALTVAMGTTLGAERWYLSKKCFAGKEDILAVLSRSQALVANSCFIGLCEVDPVTLVPLLNPNIAADGNGASDFMNRGGCEFGLTTTTTRFQAESIGNGSPAKASGSVGVAGSVLTTTQEFLIEVDSRDIIVSSSAVDAVSGKDAGASRVSTQCPDDTKLYKLVMRFKNSGTPGSGTSFVIQRVLVADNCELRVQVSTGEGDTIAAKSLGVNVNNAVALAASSALIGILSGTSPATNTGYLSKHKRQSTADTNLVSVKASAGNVGSGTLRNRHATLERFIKFYDKASVPTIGTDVPVWTVSLPAVSPLIGIAYLVGASGLRFTTGIAYCITGAYADADATAIGAADVDVNLGYS